MKYLLLLSLLVSVIIGVMSHSTPAVNTVKGVNPTGDPSKVGNPIIDAASSAVQQTDAATRANAEAINQWQQRTSTAPK